MGRFWGGAGYFDAGPRFTPVNIRRNGKGSVPRSERVQLESNPLIGGERSGAHPRREPIGGGRLHGDVMAEAGEIDVGLSVKHYPQGTVAGVLFLWIDANLHTAQTIRKKP